MSKQSGHSVLNRYAIIHEKNPREILLLRGSGCTWKRCRFCSYHLDFSKDKSANFRLNQEELLKVTGIYGKLEIVNSGSFVDLDNATMHRILKVCKDKAIDEIHFESHWIHRNEIAHLRKTFEAWDITAKMKIGIESFDTLFRECYLDKGIDTECPKEIARYFDEVCLLQGIPGQTKSGMIQDIETGLTYFERICINIMIENDMPVKPDQRVIELFMQEVLPIYINHNRVDILLENTDFGIG